MRSCRVGRRLEARGGVEDAEGRCFFCVCLWGCLEEGKRKKVLARAGGKGPRRRRETEKRKCIIIFIY